MILPVTNQASHLEMLINVLMGSEVSSCFHHEDMVPTAGPWPDNAVILCS